ncbi:MAG: hypothetical protein GY850_06980 [bacterium]|nr:hypothetical protein [bacterium]
MSSKLPINLEDLLRQRKVEGDRIEYKKGWNPDPIMRTPCAFANDFENLGGGYVVIGQECDETGMPVFPPAGVPDNQLDGIQRELLRCCNQIRPPYFPMLSVERFAGRNLIVLWASGGQNLTEGRSTGISKVLKVMKENGSPPPEFETDGDRSYFLTRLSAHPKVESKESARVDTKRKTSEKTSVKILTEIRNNRKCLSD